MPAKNDSPDIYLTLNISVNEGFSGSTSRADNNYYFEEPERQNEKLNNLYTFIYSATDGIVEGLRYTTFNAQGEMIGETSLTFKLKEGPKRICLIGNSTSLSDEIRKLCSDISVGSKFPEETLNSSTLQRGNNRVFFTSGQDIPMSETFDINLKSTEPNKPTYINASLFLTRIAVKYTVMCPDNASSLKIRLRHMAKKQYFMPNFVIYDPGKYQPAQVINGISGRNITYFSSPAANEQDFEDFELELTGKILTTAKNIDGSDSEISTYRYDSFYLMETPGSEFQISVLADENLKDNNGNSIEGEWYQYTTLPNLPLLPRNTHVIINMSMFSDIKFDVDVVPYRGCVLEPYFGLKRD